MSLFKARNLWSFDLGQLESHAGLTASDGDLVADFAMDVGRLSAIGEDRDVIIAGNLRGFLYIIQVPESDPNDSLGDNSRQMLAATKLSYPIVDIKCGYFTSGTRQTIATLTFNKLTVHQVNKRPIDLLSSPLEIRMSNQDDGCMLVDESVLSHEFEELYMIDLMADELTQCLVILRSNPDDKEVNLDSHDQEVWHKKDTDSDKGGKTIGDGSSSTRGRRFLTKSKQIVQQFHLPQRDRIIVQYSNQYVITLIENRKVVGHFEMRGPNLDTDRRSSMERQDVTELDANANESTNHQDQRLQESSKHVGLMPLAYFDAGRESSLIVSMSDYKIYCIHLEKFNQHAKQTIVKRVAINLLQAGNSQAANQGGNGRLQNPGLFKDNQTDKIIIELDKTVEWSRTLTGQPLQIASVRRKRHLDSVSHHKDSHVNQVLVMLRYELNLFDHAGNHLWAQKLETPLLCMSAYTVRACGEIETPSIQTSSQGSGGVSEQSNRNKMNLALEDSLIILASTDCLVDKKSNLIVFKGDCIAWTALLDSKPMKIARYSSRKISGLIAALDARCSRVDVCYLGTNLEQNELSTTGSSNETDKSKDGLDKTTEDDDCLSRLEQLDEDILLRSDVRIADERLKSTDSLHDREDLRVSVKLEASDKWPNVQVKCTIDILPALESSRALRNLVATLQFDDLLALKVDDSIAHLVYSSSDSGVCHFKLGNCWPDRRESIKILVSFSLLSSGIDSQVGTVAMDNLDSSSNRSITEQRNRRTGLVPSSLSVKLILDYNETYLGNLVQSETFLLPLSMLTDLEHLDYTSGQGQNLSDILGNLHQRRSSSNDVNFSEAGPECTYFCDIFLNLKCEMIDILEEILEHDLICRGSEMPKSEYGSDKAAKSDNDQRAERILEVVNLLAQSLDCRLKYRSPTGLVRQTSEEVSAPKMLSLAVRFANHYANTSERISRRDQHATENDDDRDLVWIHIVDLTSEESETNLGEELFKLHVSNWSGEQSKDFSVIPSGETQGGRIQISIESERPHPVIFFRRHLIERLRTATLLDPRVCMEQISPKSVGGKFQALEVLLHKGYNFSAISKNLASSLSLLTRDIDSNFATKHKNLQEELSEELSKFQVSLSASMSLVKRLPDLSEEMLERSRFLAMLTKQYQARIMILVDKLETLKGLDYELSKLPHSENIWIVQRHSDEAMVWPPIERIFD